MGKTSRLVAVVLWCVSFASGAEPIPYERAADARPGLGRTPTWNLGTKTNILRVYLPCSKAARHGLSPVCVDNEFRRRNVTTAAEWEKLRPGIRKAVRGYFGKMPPRDIPLDAKVEQSADKADYRVELLTIAFDKKRRGRIALLVPKGVPRPVPTVILYDAWGGGIRRATGGIYSRALGVHLARTGFLVAALDHWDEEFGKSVELSTIGAAVHFTSRTIDYLLTRKDLVDPARIGIFGHIYGAEVAQFAAAMDERIASVAHSCSWLSPTRHYSAAFWSPPFWASGSAGMACINRASREMYCSRRRVNARPLPFLTQEMLALIAPRPMLGINTGMGVGVGARASAYTRSCLAPVWALYGRPWALELIDHRWGTNEPVNARDFLVDFYLRSMCGVNPHKAPPATASAILAGLRCGKVEEQLPAARLAVWWRCRQATGELARLVNSKDVALRRAAAKGLERVGAMEELFKHVNHDDPVVRIVVVEAIQLHGTKQTFDYLAKNDSDVDRWVNEAKWQTLQVNPWE